jgi:pimeloyl-ACP methyl ester carboxylesterase
MATSKQTDWKSLALKTAGVVAGAGVTGVTAWLLYSRFVLSHQRPLPKAIDARRREDDFRGFVRISHYEDTAGQGTPLVLLHSINAAASAYEMKPLFEHHRGGRPVYAPDLPGFGFSSRPDRVYTADFYSEAIATWIERQVYQGKPVDAVALGLTCEFAARAALGHPNLFRSLAMISPTGFDKNPAGENRRTIERVRKTLSVPLWSQAFYDALVTKPSLRLYLRKTFAGPIDEGLADYDYETSHQPGARYAPLYFVAGNLFSPDILPGVYGSLSTPSLVIYDHDEYAGSDQLPEFLKQHPNWSAVRIPNTGSMPHFESRAETAGALDAFWFNAPALVRRSNVSSTLRG